MDAGAHVQKDVQRRPNDPQFLVSEYGEQAQTMHATLQISRRRAKVRAVVGTIALLAGCQTPAPAASITEAEWGPIEQWALGAMSGALADDDECYVCHVGGADPADDDFAELVLRDHVDDVAGHSADELGAGAICVDCHRGADSPQAEVFLGRGAMTLGSHAERALTHALAADSCLACHAPAGADDSSTLTLGHTFETRTDDSITQGACAHCHGDVDPLELGRSVGLDATSIGRDLETTRAALDARDPLVDLAEAERDLRMLERDGSRGVHNPRFARDVLDAVRAQLDLH